mmetsp:Transcript_3625/g.8947  ORF Transcript_3625/g.8947 Transcript_3625/m.8947 type:complete len:164 (+) Transcript_3625:620-1111(+)
MDSCGMSDFSILWEVLAISFVRGSVLDMNESSGELSSERNVRLSAGSSKSESEASSKVSWRTALTSTFPRLATEGPREDGGPGLTVAESDKTPLAASLGYLTKPKFTPGTTLGLFQLSPTELLAGFTGTLDGPGTFRPRFSEANDAFAATESRFDANSARLLL